MLGVPISGTRLWDPLVLLLYPLGLVPSLPLIFLLRSPLASFASQMYRHFIGHSKNRSFWKKRHQKPSERTQEGTAHVRCLGWSPHSSDSIARIAQSISFYFHVKPIYAAASGIWNKTWGRESWCEIRNTERQIKKTTLFVICTWNNPLTFNLVLNLEFWAKLCIKECLRAHFQSQYLPNLVRMWPRWRANCNSLIVWMFVVWWPCHQGFLIPF